jgi:hypothetical protein
MPKRRGLKKSTPRRPPHWLDLSILAVILTLIATTSILWTYSTGQILAYGDAEAHLNIARKLWDNRHPAYSEIGTVWLPVPHLLMLPFTWIDPLYRNGLAGAIPTAVCWVTAGLLLYAAVRRLAGTWEPAACAVGIFALNPNLFYLASTPMTEPVLYVAVAGVLYSLATYRETGRATTLIAAILWTWCAVMTRYEGWLLIPAASLFLVTRKWKHAALYAGLASLAPLYWFAHNWWVYGDLLEFYRGEWSAKAIYLRGHPPGVALFPAHGHWGIAWLYYRTAVQLALGSPVVWIMVLGSIAALWKRWYWFLLLLLAGPALTLWGMESGGGVEIFVPTLWPHSYYNSRYALALLPLAAFSGAALVSIVPKFRGTVAAAVVLVAIAPWLAYPRPDNWIVWKEGQVNSIERRSWTHRIAGVLRSAYRPGDRILYSFGDLTGILREAGVPLKAGLQSGNELEWIATLARPDLFLDQDWVLDFEDGNAARAALAVKEPGYTVAARIARDHNAPAVVLLRRNPLAILRQ